MKPTYEELELQLEESQREFRAADATINNLELKITDMAVQLANAESKCRELAAVVAENAALKNPDNWLSQSDYGYEASEVATQNGATEDESLRAGMIAIINRIGTPATDAFVAEVRASELDSLAGVAETMLVKLSNQSCSSDMHEVVGWKMVLQHAANRAAQLRKGAEL